MGIKKFTTKVLPLKDNLLRVVYRITGDVKLSEDIVEEVMLKLWHERHSWMVIDNLPAYSLMVARNMALNSVSKSDENRRKLYTVG